MAPLDDELERQTTLSMATSRSRLVLPGRVVVGRGKGLGFLSGMSENASVSGQDAHINVIGAGKMAHI